MGTFTGEFIPSSLTGPRTISVDGTLFSIPENAVVARVLTKHRYRSPAQSVAHVLTNGRVFVLTAAGMLDQPDDVRRKRAQPDAWAATLRHSLRGTP